LPGVPGLRGGAHRSAGPGVQSGGRFSGRLGVSALFLSGVSVDPTTLANPAVDGISFFIYWRDFYTNQNDPNSIDWTKVDTVFTEAAAAGKFVRLIVAPGFYSPTWVLNSVPVLMLQVPEGPLSGTQPMPVPWDDTYLSYWLDFVDQLGARYGGKPNFAWISVTG